jgi:hypothetical protein
MASGGGSGVLRSRGWLFRRVTRPIPDEVLREHASLGAENAPIVTLSSLPAHGEPYVAVASTMAGNAPAFPGGYAPGLTSYARRLLKQVQSSVKSTIIAEITLGLPAAQAVSR